MSYNDSNTVEELVSTSINSTILNVAQSIIHAWTMLRWESTDVTRRFSAENNRVIFLNYPITSWDYLKEIDQENDDETELTRYSDYDLDEETGKLDISGGTYNLYFPPSETTPPGRFVRGYNNYEVSYTYGYDSSNVYYPIVQYVEAAIGLEIKKNPLLLQTIRLTGGDSVSFGNDGIHKLLLNIPTGRGTGKKI